jgi:Domain of unknown function (DUF4407)
MAADNNQKETSLYTYESFGEKQKPSEFKFLWWCAGAHQKLLKEYPSEQTKYSGLGGVILATFVLATLSGGYAIQTIFNNRMIALPLAIIWGLIIFNFDRFLVSTMRKYGVSRKKQIWMATPRIALALIIGLTIARPLELKIFEKEINTKVAENIHKKIQLNDSLLRIENTALVQNATNERNRLTARKMSIEDTLHLLQQSYVHEADGTGGSLQRGIQDITRLKMGAYNQALAQYTPELEQLKNSTRQQDSILNSANADMEAKRKEYEKAVAANIGFLERNKALTDLTHEESSVFWSNLLISLLIILIETGPVLSKLMMPVGPYDLALAKEELLHMAASENDIRQDKEISFEKKKLFYQKQKEMSDKLVDKLSALQEKHINDELEKWDRGDWNPKDHRASMDEVMRKIKDQYRVNEDGLI